MKIDSLKKVLGIIAPYMIDRDQWYIEHAFDLARFFGVDDAQSECCDAYIDRKTNTITIRLYIEDYHTGTEYDKSEHHFHLTDSAINAAIKMLEPRAVEVIENKLKYEDRNKFRVQAEKLVSDMIR